MPRTLPAAWAPHLACLAAEASGFLKELAQGMPASMLGPSPHGPSHRAPAAGASSTSGGAGGSATPSATALPGTGSLGRAFVGAVLALSSITTPFTLSCAGTAELEGTAGAEQPHPGGSGTLIAPGSGNSGAAGVGAGACGPLAAVHAVRLLPPAGVPPSSQAAVDGALVALLVAAQALVRKSDAQQQCSGEQGHALPTLSLPP